MKENTSLRDLSQGTMALECRVTTAWALTDGVGLSHQVERASAGPSWAHRFFLCALLLLMLGGWSSVVCAYTTCASYTPALNGPSLSPLLTNTGQNGQAVWVGTFTLTANNCVGGPNQAFEVINPLANLASGSLAGVPGLIITMAPLSYTVSGSGCSFKNWLPWGAPGASIYFNAPSAGYCNVSVTWTTTFTMNTASGAISGVTSANSMVQEGPGVTSDWGSAVVSGSNSPDYVGNGPVFTVSQEVCTLSSTATVVTLPNVYASQLSASGATAEKTGFTLGLTGCSNVGSNYTVSAQFSYTPVSGTTNIISNTAATSPAQNIGFQLLDSSGNPIANNQVVPLATVGSSSSYTSQLYAQYYSYGVGGGGNVSGLVTLTLTY